MIQLLFKIPSKKLSKIDHTFCLTVSNNDNCYNKLLFNKLYKVMKWIILLLRYFKFSLVES